MKFENLRKPTIKEIFIGNMESLILSGQLAIGEKLPTERTMAQEMGISKTAVHDGLKALERMGFVKSVPKQGTFVTDYVETGSLETLNAILRYNNDRMDAQTYASILELRIVLEPLSFRKFVDKATEADYARLGELFEIAERIPVDMAHSAEWAEALYNYHQFIYIKSGNNLFSLIYNTFKHISLIHFKKYCETRPDHAKGRIESIHKHLLAGNAEAAGTVLIDEIHQYCALSGLSL